MGPLPEWSDLPRRKSPRLPVHDYRLPGAYFLTSCIHNRVPLLGRVESGIMVLNGIGRMVDEVIRQSQGRYAGVELDIHCVMQDHFHLIVWLRPGENIGIPGYMNRIKSLMASRYRPIRNAYPRLPQQLLQRSYWDRYIRDEEELEQYRYYIQYNPLAFQIERDRVVLRQH